MDHSTHSHDDLVAFAFGMGMALVMCLRRCSLCVRYIFMLRSQCDPKLIIPLIFSFINNNHRSLSAAFVSTKPAIFNIPTSTSTF